MQQRSTCLSGSAFDVAEANVLYKLFVNLLKGAQIGVPVWKYMDIIVESSCHNACSNKHLVPELATDSI